MSAFAIILLSESFFGGAQKRFLNLHLFLRKKYGNRAWFIVTQSMKTEIISVLGEEYTDGIFAIGEIPQNIGQAKKPIKTNSRDSVLYKLIKKTGILYFYSYYKSKQRAYRDFEQIDRFAREKKINSFLAVYNGVLPLYFYMNMKDRSKRIVFSNMDSWFSHFEKNPIKRYLNQYTLFHRAHEESDHIDFLSPFILDGVKSKNYLPPKQNYSITACSFIDFEKCFSSEKSQPEFVFSGRLEEDKNPLLFLNAAIHLSDSHPNVKFHILGKGRLSEKIQSTIKASKFNNIIYHGYTPNPCEFFAESSVLVSLQKENNYPSQSVLEAMACGNAIIASDVGDTRLFINSENGWLINNSQKELEDAMLYCIRNHEETLIKGKFAQTYVKEHFNIERAAEYYYSLLNPEINE
ncbi:MAG: glycosyltransferase [Bacteroidia bacterium]